MNYLKFKNGKQAYVHCFLMPISRSPISCMTSVEVIELDPLLYLRERGGAG